LSGMPLSWYWFRGLQRASIPPARLVRPMEKIHNSTNKLKKDMACELIRMMFSFGICLLWQGISCLGRVYEFFALEDSFRFIRRVE
jgi:hypothetical protein